MKEYTVNVHYSDSSEFEMAVRVASPMQAILFALSAMPAEYLTKEIHFIHVSRGKEIKG